jgi:hypothetical protein
MSEKPKRTEQTRNQAGLAIIAAFVLGFIVCIAAGLIFSVVTLIGGVEVPTLEPELAATRDAIAATNEVRMGDFEATNEALFEAATATAEAAQ